MRVTPMRSFVVALFLSLLTIGPCGCTPVQGGAHGDSGEAGPTAATIAPFDAGDGGSVAPADAGPPDDGIPSSLAPDLTARGRHLLEAIARDNPELATDIVFPRDAFVAARDTADPAKLWDQRIYPGFQRDVHLFKKRITGADRVQFVSFEIGHSVQQIIPKRHDWKRPLWRVKHSKLTFTVDGKQGRLEVMEMTSWHGAWYITKLR